MNGKMRFNCVIVVQQRISQGRIFTKALHGWMTITFCVGFLVLNYAWLRHIMNCCCQRPLLSKKNSIIGVPTIYVITATYPRLEQIAELTRLAQTLMHVPNLVWLVIEDATEKSEAVAQLLKRTGIEHVHLTAPMPEDIRRLPIPRYWLPRGVSNRNRGLQWIRANATTGVIYFADDDNSYDIKLFQEMRDTKRVSMWPVGLLGNGFSSPVVSDGKVVGFYDAWINSPREYHVDMAGFAVGIEFLLQRPKAVMPFTVGYEEDGFLLSLAPFNKSQIEPKAKNCTEYRY